jgi:hypothetical protein
MAAGVNLVADISSYVQTIFEMANLVARDENFVVPLVTNFSDQSGTAQRTRSDYGTVTYNQINDSDDLSSQVFKPTANQSLTPYEYGAQFFLSDRRVRTDKMQVMREAANELGQGAAKKIQTDILKAGTALTGGTVGSAGGTASWGTIYKGIATLKQKNAPGPYVGILGNGMWYHLGTPNVPAGNQTNAPMLQDQIVRAYNVAFFYNTFWFLSNDLVGALGTAC